MWTVRFWWRWQCLIMLWFCWCFEYVAVGNAPNVCVCSMMSRWRSRLVFCTCLMCTCWSPLLPLLPVGKLCRVPAGFARLCLSLVNPSPTFPPRSPWSPWSQVHPQVPKVKTLNGWIMMTREVPDVVMSIWAQVSCFYGSKWAFSLLVLLVLLVLPVLLQMMIHDDDDGSFVFLQDLRKQFPC